MTNIEQAQTDFTAALKAQLKKTLYIAPKPRCALRISFYDENQIDFVANSFKPITGELVRVNNVLMKIFDAVDEAQKHANSLNSIIYTFNQSTLERPVTPEWLQDYYEVQSLGINVIGVDKSVQCIEDEVKRQQNKVNDDPKQYSARRAFAKASVLDYSLADLQADVTAFLVGCINIPEGKNELVLNSIHSMFSQLMQGVKGKLALENHANQRLVMAINEKSLKISEANGVEDRAKVQAYRQGEAKKEVAERFRQDIKLSFYDVKDAIVDSLTNLLSVADLADNHTSFTGLDLMYSSAFELSDFSKSGLEAIAGSQYCSIGTAAAYVLTDLFLEYFRIYANAKHKMALMDLSRNLAIDNLYSDAIESIYRDLVIQ